jgi:uncharacterized membrane protein
MAAVSKSFPVLSPEAQVGPFPASDAGSIIRPLEINYRFMTHLSKNVGTEERFLSIFGGAYLLYDTMTKRKTNLLQTMAGTYLLLRGVTGFYLVYDRLGKKDVSFRAPNVNIRTSMIVNRPRDQVYAFWRRLANLPKFMKHLKKVEVLDDHHSEWTAALTEDRHIESTVAQNSYR